jgi:tripartite-type tricarboxylate transporter receptor subunit TctC
MFGQLRAMLACALASIVILAHPLAAQQFPVRPVTIIVPSTAGGGTDIIARIIGDALSRQLGQAFVVENRPGAGSLVGTVAAANATPDGYTLLAGLNANMAVNPSLFAKLPYDPIRDFAPVAMLADYPFVVVVSKSLPVHSIGELVALAQSKPGGINYDRPATAPGSSSRPSCSS